MPKNFLCPKLPKIVYSDNYFLVVDKPSGWTVLYGSRKLSLFQEWLKKTGKIASGSSFLSFKQRTGIVHRLDRDTSGLLLIGRYPESFASLQHLFHERTITKTYICLVAGETPREGVISAPIARSKSKKSYTVRPGGREASTKFRRIDKFTDKKGEKFSLLEVTPLSGRTHQIRVHFHYLGYPLAGDNVYGGDRFLSSRLFLHASILKFTHPFTKKEVIFKSPLPKDLCSVIEKIERLS